MRRSSTLELLALAVLFPACSDGGSGGGGGPPPVLAATGNGYFLEVDAATGECTPISGNGFAGFASVMDTTFDPDSGTMYGADFTTGQSSGSSSTSVVTGFSGLPRG